MPTPSEAKSHGASGQPTGDSPLSESEISLMHSLYATGKSEKPARKTVERVQLGQPYSAVEIHYRHRLSWHEEKDVLPVSGVWGGDVDPATDEIAKQLIRADRHDYYVCRANLLLAGSDSTSAYPVGLDSDSRVAIGTRAHRRAVAEAERREDLRAHSFPADQLRKSMRIRLNDGRDVTIDRISISSYSPMWSIYGKDDSGNEVSGSIDSRKPVYVHNHTRR